jgi:hypothetical protein
MKMNERLLREWVKESMRSSLVVERVTAVNFRGSGISPASVKSDFKRYAGRFEVKFDEPTEVGVVKSTKVGTAEDVKVVETGSQSGEKKGDMIRWSRPQSGSTVKIDPQEIQDDWVVFEYQAGNEKKGYYPSWGVAIRDTSGVLIPITALQKADFFDKSGGSTDRLAKETAQIESLSGGLKEIIEASEVEYATLIIPGTTRKSPPKIVGLETLTGAKADLKAVGVVPQDNVFVSLKDGTTVKEFQQYGGVARDFKDNPVVSQFAYKVWGLTCPKEGQPNTRMIKVRGEVYQEISNTPGGEELMLKTVYGRNADEASPYGKEKCDMLIQGTPDEIGFEVVGPILDDGSLPVQIKADGHQMVYPALPGEDDPFRPVLMARRDNSTTLSGVGPFSRHQGVRILSYPYGKLAGTAVEIDKALDEIYAKVGMNVPADIATVAYDDPICLLARKEKEDSQAQTKTPAEREKQAQRDRAHSPSSWSSRQDDDAADWSDDPQGRLAGEGRLRTLRNLIRETLLTEELTKSDKKEIEKITRKQMQRDTVLKKELEKIIQKQMKRDQIDKKEITKIARQEAEAEIKKSLGASFLGTPGKINKAIQDIAREEMQTALKGKELEKAAADVTKRVLYAFYKMMYNRKNLIDDIKLS